MDPTVSMPPTSPDGEGVERVTPGQMPWAPAPITPTQHQLDEAALRLAGTADEDAAEELAGQGPQALVEGVTIDPDTGAPDAETIEDTGASVSDPDLPDTSAVTPDIQAPVDVRAPVPDPDVASAPQNGDGAPTQVDTSGSDAGQSQDPQTSSDAAQAQS